MAILVWGDGEGCPVVCLMLAWQLENYSDSGHFCVVYYDYTMPVQISLER